MSWILEIRCGQFLNNNMKYFSDKGVFLFHFQSFNRLNYLSVKSVCRFIIYTLRNILEYCIGILGWIFWCFVYKCLIGMVAVECENCGFFNVRNIFVVLILWFSVWVYCCQFFFLRYVCSVIYSIDLIDLNMIFNFGWGNFFD